MDTAHRIHRPRCEEASSNTPSPKLSSPTPKSDKRLGAELGRSSASLWLLGRVSTLWLVPLLIACFPLAWVVTSVPGKPYGLSLWACALVACSTAVVLASRAGRALLHRVEQAAKKQEQERIFHELHDTVKQNVHGVTLLLESCLRSEPNAGVALVRERVDQALAIAREAVHQLSKPMDGPTFLEIYDGEDLMPSFGRWLEKQGERFGVKVEEDLQAPLEVLDEAEAAAACRVLGEAAWNATKHAAPSSLRIESRWRGPTLVVRLQDDGRGFCTKGASTGTGLRLMRARATEVGARLVLSSRPRFGTTVELAFDKSDGQV